jgi:hypothetical protein
VELLGYHAGWAFALNRALGEPGFDPTVLVRFRERLIRHEKAAAVFTAILEGLQEAGLVARQSKQRLDSMFVMGRPATRPGTFRWKRRRRGIGVWRRCGCRTISLGRRATPSDG